MMSSTPIISLIPDTRTIKNSSRLVAKIERNLSRSSRGTELPAASSRMRRKNSSCIRSWLKTDHARKCLGFDDFADGFFLLGDILSRCPSLWEGLGEGRSYESIPKKD